MKWNIIALNALKGTKQDELTKHTKLKHTLERGIKCRNCGTDFELKADLMIHRKAEHKNIANMKLLLFKTCTALFLTVCDSFIHLVFQIVQTITVKCLNLFCICIFRKVCISVNPFDDLFCWLVKSCFLFSYRVCGPLMFHLNQNYLKTISMRMKKEEKQTLAEHNGKTNFG